MMRSNKLICIHNNTIYDVENYLYVEINKLNSDNIYIDLEFLITKYYNNVYEKYINNKSNTYYYFIDIFNLMLYNIDYIFILDKNSGDIYFLNCNDNFIQNIVNTYYNE